MEITVKASANDANYLKIANECLMQDSGTWYTEEAQFAFAKYLEENNRKQVNPEDLYLWKKLVHI